jgi:hypothetical protein
MNEISSGGIEIFPNPASDMILIKSASEINSVILLNNLGQEMFRTEVNALNFKINVAEFEDGIYFIKLETNESAVVRKLTIN